MTLSAQKTISYQPKKKRTKSVKSIKIGTKKKLSLTTSCLLTQVSLRSRLLKKINLIEAVERTIQPLESMSLRLLKKTKTNKKLKT